MTVPSREPLSEERLAEVEAENRRLRAALSRIADNTSCTAPLGSSKHHGHKFCVRHVALTALASSGQQERA